MSVDLTEMAIGIIILGVVVSVGAVTLNNFRDSQTTNLPVVSAINVSADAKVNEGGTHLSTIFAKTTPSLCINQSNNVIIPTANYTTVIGTDGRIAIAYSGPDDGGTSGLNNTIWKCTYTRHNVSDLRWDIPNKAQIGLGEYGNWFKILVIVAVAAVILGLIFIAFRGSGHSVKTAAIGGEVGDMGSSKAGGEKAVY